VKGKKEKLNKIRAIIRDDLPYRESRKNFNFLSKEIKKKYNIINTKNVSSNSYDPIALSIIEEHSNGLILDCGSGKRSTYYNNVVNFEIAPYDTTDVLGVGEELPFKDNVFDAVFSLAVLEHVKDPFKCASEISRVMKPGATLYCVVPFLQPLHGYPNHYYNMSMQGLKNLFDDFLHIEKQEVIASGLPIWTLTWFLNSWLSGLDRDAKNEFLRMTVADLIGNPIDYFEQKFVKELPMEKNIELACTTALIAKKPPLDNPSDIQPNNSFQSDEKKRRSLLAQLFSVFDKNSH
jgi:SAM-dependent methyltransferase